MATFANPLDQVADYRQRKLNSLLSGEGIHPDVAVGPTQALSDDGQDRRQQFSDQMSDISASGSNQSALYTMAVQKKNQLAEEERQRKYMAEQMKKIQAAQAKNFPVYKGTSTYKPSGSNSSKKLVGPYKLTQAANNSYNALAAAYKRAGFGNLTVNSGGRTYDEQVYLYNLYKAGKGNLAAKPGTSVHESGRAIDFGGAAHNAGTAAHNWLVANAGKYGWSWTGKNFSQFEPWHFEYTG